MRKTIRSSATVIGAITLLVLGVVAISPVVVTTGILLTAGLMVASVMPGGIAYRVADKISDMQIAMGRAMRHKIWSHMR